MENFFFLACSDTFYQLLQLHIVSYAEIFSIKGTVGLLPHLSYQSIGFTSMHNWIPHFIHTNFLNILFIIVYFQQKKKPQQNKSRSKCAEISILLFLIMKRDFIPNVLHSRLTFPLFWNFYSRRRLQKKLWCWLSKNLAYLIPAGKND